MKMSARSGRKRTIDSHCVLNLLNMKLSLGAMESGLPLLSKKKKMTE
jgi:hypothetical protein